MSGSSSSSSSSSSSMPVPVPSVVLTAVKDEAYAAGHAAGFAAGFAEAAVIWSAALEGAKQGGFKDGVQMAREEVAALLEKKTREIDGLRTEVERLPGLMGDMHGLTA